MSCEPNNNKRRVHACHSAIYLTQLERIPQTVGSDSIYPSKSYYSLLRRDHLQSRLENLCSITDPDGCLVTPHPAEGS